MPSYQRRALYRGYVDIDETGVREHLHWLHSKGVSWTAIALEVGLTPAAISFISIKGRGIPKATADALLAITPALRLCPERDASRPTKGEAHGPRVPKLGAIRRIRALQCMGYNLNWQQERLGFDIRGFLYRGGSEARLPYYEKIVALYDEVSHLVGPDPTARYWGFKNKYYPPGAWNDIDDPDEKPERRDQMRRVPSYRERKLTPEAKAKFPPCLHEGCRFTGYCARGLCATHYPIHRVDHNNARDNRRAA